MKRLPDAELELMMIIWNLGGTVTRTDIEQHLKKGRNVVPSTILTLLSRLTERGFLQVSKQGKTNYYTPMVEKKDYQSSTGKSFLKNVFGNSFTNFTVAMYDGGEIGDEDLKALRAFLDEKLSNE